MIRGGERAEGTRALEFAGDGKNAPGKRGICLSPGRCARGQELLDPHRTHATNEGRTIDLVSVPNDVVRRVRVAQFGAFGRAPQDGQLLSQGEVF